ncbi:MAG: hypothetical protein KF715_18315 [Candidatus Didemnitutus sp.]|nr:hypothetical protein [Candidatus Didemnitutus sp.]
MKTNSVLRLLVRVALCVAAAALAWGWIAALEQPPRSEASGGSADMVIAGMARVPLAAPWVVQVSSLLRAR